MRIMVESSGDRQFRILDWGRRRVLWIDSERIEECLRFYRHEKLDGVVICPPEYRRKDIEFLREHPYIQGVVFLLFVRVDLSPLQALKDLRFLSYEDCRQPVDLSVFPRLEEVRVDWHAGLQLPEHSRALRILALWKYKPSSRDLTELPDLPELEELVMVQSPLTSIDGVERYRTLKRLELSYLTRLERIGAIAGLAGSGLEELDCLKCKRITDHSAVRALSSLKILRFNGCGQMPDIRFLDDMSNLEDFRFVNTDVVNGDLRPCLRLKGVGFTRKKHFSHTPKEVKKIIEHDA